MAPAKVKLILMTDEEKAEEPAGEQETEVLISKSAEEVQEQKRAPQEHKEKVPVVIQIVRCFSAIRNARKLLTVSDNKGELSALEGIRVLSLFWVILGHTNQLLVYTPLVNRNEVVEMAQQPFFQIITNAVFSVDTFFVMSGFIAAYIMLPEINKRSNFNVLNILQIYGHRIWRITPTYLLVVLFLTFVYPSLTSGPLWPIASQLSANCSKWWWRNLLYINNMYPSSEECVAWGWYLANDMQFFIITPWLLWILSRKPKIGKICLGLVMAASTLYCIIVTIKYNLDTYWLGSSLTGGPPDAASRGDYGDLIYRKPWARIQSYIIGVYAAYMHLQHGSKLFSSQFVVFWGWIFSIVCMNLCIFGLHGEQIGQFLAVDAQVFYISLSRIAWSLAVCFIILVCAYKKAAYVNEFLSMNVWVPLSRMGLAAYLVHVIMISVFLGSWKTGFYFSPYTVLYLYLGHLIMTYAVAFPLTILIESPLRLIEKIKFK